jgi:hypothetical protein
MRKSQNVGKQSSSRDTGGGWGTVAGLCQLRPVETTLRLVG